MKILFPRLLFSRVRLIVNFENPFFFLILFNAISLKE